MSETHQDLLPGQGGPSEDGESWLMSYLDVLTLLITLFVLLLSLSDPATDDRPPSAATADPGRPATSGVQPRHSGLLPQLEGVDVSRSAAGLNLRIQDRLLFASGQAELTDDGRRILQGLVPFLSDVRGEISIEGHTDDIPIHTARYPSNWELSSARASAVLRYLLERGIRGERLRAIGYAATRPLQPGEDAESRAANRRVELLIHEKNPRDSGN
ncbi:MULTISPECIES: OmpA family protein [unclassified Modicisalibacter]|uniref:OmpA/MotB family protein n=1 Tax=unclassified Modicisalibacter TaxID=2679913 RepID=UPI001CC98ECC|nr:MULTISPECIES: OmpA family protein [unclassified Modicisalibacter]MBZ9556533.1 OmpA family protein [Modicisalibacter sp. R2A 31.J]MBZ9574998.1 OmpA family protein [Modicisalibacter sp. MOD 31.J]